MKEEDIDKIFRDALADHKAPTEESDWATFEGILDSKRTSLSKWTVLIALFILICGSSAAYIFLSNAQAEYIPRAQNSKSLTVKNKNAEQLGAQADGKDEKLTQSSIANTDRVRKEQNSEQLYSINKLEQSESSSSQNGQSSSQFGISKNEGDHKANSAQPSSGIDYPGDEESYQKVDADENLSRSMASSESFQSENPALIDAKADTLNDFKHQETSTRLLEVGSTTAANKGLGSSGFELGELKFMSALDAELEKKVSAKLVNEKRSIEHSKTKLFSSFIYFKLEQNNVFQTSPALGLGLERSFPFKGKGAIAIQGAIGYQRTGRLAWEQTSQNVVYGFDRYAEESNLKTNNLGMIQIPIRVAYQTGVHRIFAGAEMNWVVNASQEFRQNPEGEISEGYLYDSGAPNSILFFQMGYGYALNEKFQFEAGLNIGDYSWVVVDKRPVGGFIRLNYFIR